MPHYISFSVFTFFFIHATAIPTPRPSFKSSTASLIGRSNTQDGFMNPSITDTSIFSDFFDINPPKAANSFEDYINVLRPSALREIAQQPPKPKPVECSATEIPFKKCPIDNIIAGGTSKASCSEDRQICRILTNEDGVTTYSEPASSDCQPYAFDCDVCTTTRAVRFCLKLRQEF